MAVYKTSYCYPFNNNCDIEVTSQDDIVWFKCKINTSNKNVTGYRIRLLDNNYNQIFPLTFIGGYISPIIEELPNFTDHAELIPDSTINTGVNGTFLWIPFFQCLNNRLTTTFNGIYYDGDSYFCFDRSGDRWPINLSANGAIYYWEITLYQGDRSLWALGGPHWVTYLSLDNSWYDMTLTSGIIMGSTTKRVQLASSADTNAILPSGTTDSPLVLQGRYMQLLQSNGDGTYDQVGPRTYVNTYDATMGHAYPLSDDTLSSSDLNTATDVCFYKHSNDYGVVQGDSGDIVDCATNISDPLSTNENSVVVYNGGNITGLYNSPVSIDGTVMLYNGDSSVITHNGNQYDISVVSIDGIELTKENVEGKHMLTRWDSGGQYGVMTIHSDYSTSTASSLNVTNDNSSTRSTTYVLGTTIRVSGLGSITNCVWVNWQLNESQTLYFPDQLKDSAGASISTLSWKKVASSGDAYDITWYLLSTSETLPNDFSASIQITGTNVTLQPISTASGSYSSAIFVQDTGRWQGHSLFMDYKVDSLQWAGDSSSYLGLGNINCSYRVTDDYKYSYITWAVWSLKQGYTGLSINTAINYVSRPFTYSIYGSLDMGLINGQIYNIAITQGNSWGNKVLQISSLTSEPTVLPLNAPCGLFQMGGYQLVANQLVLVKNQTNSWENGVYMTCAAGTNNDQYWQRSGSYLEWSNFLGKLIFVHYGASANTNWESLATAGGSLWYANNLASNNGQSPLLFTQEKPYVLFPSDITANIAAYDTAYLTSITPVSGSSFNLPLMADKYALISGDIVLSVKNSVIWFGVVQSIGTTTASVKIFSATDFFSSQLSQTYSSSATYGYHVQNGYQHGNNIMTTMGNTIAIANYLYRTAKILKNDTTHTYVAPYSSLSAQMKLKLLNDKTVAFDSAPATATSWIPITKVNSTIWQITHSALETPLLSYSSTDGTVPYRYELRSFFKTSDENPFYCYTPPTVGIKLYQQDGTTEITADSSTGIITATQGTHYVAKGSYVQDQQASWESYRWVLTDNNVDSIHYGEVLQDTGLQYDQKMELDLYGIIADTGEGAATANYKLVLYVTDSLNNSLSTEKDFSVDFSAFQELSDTVFTMQYDYYTHSILLVRINATSALPAGFLFRREYEKEYDSSDTTLTKTFAGKWEMVSCDTSTTQAALTWAYRDFNITSNRGYQYKWFAKTISTIPATWYCQSATLNENTPVVKTSWSCWSLCELIPQASEIKSPLVRKSYAVDLNNVWLFKYQLNTGAQTQNFTKTEFSNLGQYPKFGFGKNNAISGQVDCLLGSEIVPYWGPSYIERTFNSKRDVLTSNDRIMMLRQWRAVAFSPNPKLLTDIKGQSWIVQVTSNSNTPYNFYYNQPDTISFSWKQVDSVDNLTIIEKSEDSNCSDLSITSNLMNCAGSASNPTTITDTATLTFTANSGCTMPKTITVSGADYTYNQATGEVILTNPTSNVTIAIIAFMGLSFYSEDNTSISLNVTNKTWDGTLEYSYDNSTWNTFNAGTTYTGLNIYLRGIGNTVISYLNATAWGLTLTGTKIHCDGNIQSLLDYNSPSTTLADYCYSNMFDNCTALTTAPSLPATTLANYCYTNMFYNCTSLITAPSLPATTLANYCYSNMFFGCTALTTAPSLPATTLADYCYSNMFYRCTALTTAPSLPATTLANYCYRSMFYGCTALTTAPSLPATTLANYCYYNMFYGCSLIKLSTTQDSTYTTAYRIPTSGTGTIRTSSLDYMFASTGGSFTGTPRINTTYYTQNISV